MKWYCCFEYPLLVLQLKNMKKLKSLKLKNLLLVYSSVEFNYLTEVSLTQRIPPNILNFSNLKQLGLKQLERIAFDSRESVFVF